MAVLRRALLVAAPVTILTIGVGVGLVHPSHLATEHRSDVASGGVSAPESAPTVVRRQSFCHDVPTAEVRAALGGRPTRATSYDDGQTAALTSTVRDVAGEFECAWRGRHGTSAQAWVFATPVTRHRARVLAAAPAGCDRRDGPAYGRPTVALACADSGRTTVSLRGLFGDAWLSCDLTGRSGEPAQQVAERADRWCVAVARSDD